MDNGPLLLNIASIPTRPMKGDRGTQIRLFGTDTGAKNVDLHINILKPGIAPGPYHYHERAENIYVVLDGVFEVVIEGTRYFLRKDDVVFIPPGLRHRASAAGDAPAKVLEIYAPAGEDFHVVDDPPEIIDVVPPPISYPAES